MVWAALPSPLYHRLNLVNHLLIRVMWWVMRETTLHHIMWWTQCPDEAIVQHAHCQQEGCIWHHWLKHQRTWCKLIQILMNTTLTPWRLAVHFGYLISPTAGVNKRTCTQSTPTSPMRHVTYSPSYHMVSEWRPVKDIIGWRQWKTATKMLGANVVLRQFSTAYNRIMLGDYTELDSIEIENKLGLMRDAEQR